MSLKAKMLINGQFVDASDGGVIESVNPTTGEVLGTAPSATREDVNKVLDAANEAKKVWRAMSVNKRLNILTKGADLFGGHVKELGELMVQEMGKPIGMATGETFGIAPLIRNTAAAAMHKYGTVFGNNDAEGSLGDLAVTVYEPLGVVFAISPFNFPAGILTYKVAPALAAGNAVIVHAPSDVPLYVLRYVEILQEAGFPDGVLQAISGPGRKISDWLVDSDRIDAISFTGSTATGIKLVETSAKHMHRVMLELGGNDPMIICEDADMDRAVREAMSRIINAGQVCCVQKRLLVHESVKEKFTQGLIQSLKDLPVGDPLLQDTVVGPLVSETAAKKVESQIETTVAQGAVLALGGVRNGAFITPAVLTGVTRDMDIAKDMEVFGPVFPIIGFANEDEAIEIANQTSYGLNASILSGDLQRSIRLAQRIEAGTVVANGGSFWRRDTAPFGGYKKSGLGREGIQDILDELSQRKTIVIQGV
jgi:succinate-semialdehyde dehydrogenase/glutarate-semialdehyde dehydrogenase